jgi:hypothetical protein
MPNANRQNPYTVNTVEYAGQYANTAESGQTNSAYAVPSDTTAPYTNTFGWGPTPRISVGNTPDAMRLGSMPVRTVRPEDDASPESYYRPNDADDAQRHSVEDQNANGWSERKDHYKIGPDPRWNPPVETRLTEQMSPANYAFTRPFDQSTKGNGARQFNGQHFSMADHRRDYEILGMQPWSPRRNTYRVDPAPWDMDLYDVPPAQDMGVSVQGRIQAVELPHHGNSAYRL